MMMLVEAMKKTGLKREALFYAIKTGKLEARKSGASWLITSRALNKYMAEYRITKNVAAATLPEDPPMTETPKAPLPTPKAKRSFYGNRPDLAAMAKISRILSDFDPAAAGRILDMLRMGLPTL